MTWNYRVIHSLDVGDSDVYAIQEVYYGKNGKPTAYCDASVLGDTVEGVGMVLDMMKAALDKPVLEESDFHKGAALGFPEGLPEPYVS